MHRRSLATRIDETRSTRHVILDAAEHQFAERGFAGVSVRDIAAEAGLKNQASLYNHFRNKRALYDATLTRGLQPILALLAASGAEATAAAADNRFLDPLLDYLVAHPHLPSLIQRAALDDSRSLRTAVTQLLRPLYAEGMHVLASAPAAWERAELPHLAAALYHVIFGYFANAALLQAVVQGDPLSPTALARQRRFLKGMLAQLLGDGQPSNDARPMTRNRRRT